MLMAIFEYLYYQLNTEGYFLVICLSKFGKKHSIFLITEDSLGNVYIGYELPAVASYDVSPALARAGVLSLYPLSAPGTAPSLSVYPRPDVPPLLRHALLAVPSLTGTEGEYVQKLFLDRRTYVPISTFVPLCTSYMF